MSHIATLASASHSCIDFHGLLCGAKGKTDHLAGQWHIAGWRSMDNQVLTIVDSRFLFFELLRQQRVIHLARGKILNGGGSVAL